MTNLARFRITLACFAIVVLTAPVAAGVAVSAGPVDATASVTPERDASAGSVAVGLSAPEAASAPVRVGATSTGLTVTASASTAPASGARPAWHPAPSSAPVPAGDPVPDARVSADAEAASPGADDAGAVAEEALGQGAVHEVVGVTRFVEDASVAPAPGLLERLLAALAGAADAVTEPFARDAGGLTTRSARAPEASPSTSPSTSALATVPPATAATVLAATGAAALAWVALPRGGLATLVKRVAGILGLAGYARMTGADVLDHDVRGALYALVRAHPGASLADLVSGCACGRSSVTHHLRVLEREGFVTSRRHGRHRLYFPTGTASGPRPADAPVLTALEHDTTRAVARAVVDAPGLDQSTLCARLGLAPSLAHWHTRRLEDAAVLRRERDGRRVRYYPGPLASRLDAA